MSHREPIDDAAWRPWVEHVAAALEVDASGVSPRSIHDLTGESLPAAHGPGVGVPLGPGHRHPP